MREQILDAAEQMVQERGLNAVSFQHLADAVGLSKPSIFHHFANKEALARALLERCQTKYGAHYEVIIDGDDDPPQKLRRIADLFENGLREDRVCLLGSLGSCVATLSDPARDDLRDAVSWVIGHYTRVFEAGRQTGRLRFAGEPAAAATAFLAFLEGMQILARAKGDADAFAEAARAYIDQLASDA